MNTCSTTTKVYALDFESSQENAYFGIDLRFVAAELNFFPSIERTEKCRKSLPGVAVCSITH